MVFPIAGGTQDTSYEVENSLRFNDDDNPNLTFTPSSAVTSERKTFTISWWVKRGNLGTTVFMWEMGGNDNANERIIARFDSNNRLNVNDSSTAFRIPNRLFRDPSAWYHIVVAFDTTDSTADNRVKVYVNGVQETSFLTSNNPGQNDTKGFSHNSEHTIGRTNIDNGSPFDGYMTEFHAVGGSQLDATSFGKFNENGVWIPKKYTGSHGTNGFYLEFKQTGTSANSSGMGADTSGNDNHFAATNLAAIDVTTDTCTNNFCTLNPLTARTYPVLREGNLQQHEHGTGNSAGVAATIMPINGKWYAELYLESPSGGDYPFFGITDTLNLNNKGDYGSKMAAGFEIDGATNNQSTTNFGTITNTNTGWPSFADNDIVQFALDLDNRKLWIGRNGTYINSGNPASGSNQQLSWTVSDNTSLILLGYDGSGGGGSTSKWNYGNPPFSISSGNADANGYGNFEYAPPSGYYSICTKNLAEYG